MEFSPLGNRETNMKSSLCVTLVIMGTLLIMLPPISELTMDLSLGGRITLVDVGISRLQSFVCWSSGTAMILIAVAGAFKRREKSEA